MPLARAAATERLPRSTAPRPRKRHPRQLEHVIYNGEMKCVSGERLAAAMASRRPELWDSNPRLAERIEMRIKDAQRAHGQAHGGGEEAAHCLAEQHPELLPRG